MLLTISAGRVISPRRVATFTRSRFLMPSFSASRGCISHNGSGYWSTRLPRRRVCVPLRYYDTTARKENGIFIVHVFGRGTVVERVEPGLAVVMMKPSTFEEARRAGMFGGGAGPEDTEVALDLFVIHPAVINRSAFGCGGQFVENLLRLCVAE